MADMGWSTYIADEEAANYAACFTAAERIGIRPAKAETCDDGEFKCPDCPWRAAPSASTQSASAMI